MTSPRPVRRSKRIEPKSPGGKAPGDFIQNAIVPWGVLNSACGATTIWLGDAEENSITPLWPTTSALHVASTFVAGCSPPGAASTITSLIGAASNGYRAIKL